MCSRGYCLSNWEGLGLGLGTVNVWSGRLGVERLFTEKKTAASVGVRGEATENVCVSAISANLQHLQPTTNHVQMFPTTVSAIFFLVNFL